MFLNRVAGNVLKMLNDEQREIFETLARQRGRAAAPTWPSKRLPLIKAFCRELKGEIPAGSQGLNKERVVQYVGDIFAFDAELSYRRAEVYGEVAASLTPEQKAYLAKMKFGDFNTWPEVDMEQVQAAPRHGEAGQRGLHDLRQRVLQLVRRRRSRPTSTSAPSGTAPTSAGST